uniref:US9 n=1 Tax=Elaeophora elaphi TaxID=1147741 RepID=A0A0R3RY24_9BILA
MKDTRKRRTSNKFHASTPTEAYESQPNAEKYGCNYRTVNNRFENPSANCSSNDILLFALFTAVKYAELSVYDGNNIRNIVREIELDNKQTTANAASLEITKTTDCTERCIKHNDSGGSETSLQSLQSHHKSLREIRWKIKMFWTTVMIISILWMLILISLSAILYVRIVHMHHTISQIFCPKE